jgi:hypothetical protein
MGSSRSSAAVSGTCEAIGPLYGIESSFCKAVAIRDRTVRFFLDQNIIFARGSVRGSLRVCRGLFGKPKLKKESLFRSKVKIFRLPP